MVALQTLVAELGWSRQTIYRRIKALGLETFRKGRCAYLNYQDAQTLRGMSFHEHYREERASKYHLDIIRAECDKEEAELLMDHYLRRYLSYCYTIPNDPGANISGMTKNQIMALIGRQPESEGFQLKSHTEMDLGKAMVLRQRYLRSLELYDRANGTWDEKAAEAYDFYNQSEDWITKHGIALSILMKFQSIPDTERAGELKVGKLRESYYSSRWASA